MSRIIVLLCVAVLLVIAAWLCQVDLQASSPEPIGDGVSWVRTIDGWEHVDDWTPSIEPGPSLHPLVLAAGQVLGSLLALSAFPPSTERT